MTHLTALWLFFLLVAGIVALPGLDMTFVLASALTGGRRGGFSAIGGIVAGGVVHVVMATLGIAVILQVMPKAFNALLLAGSLYVAWIGWTIFRSSIGFDGGAAAERSSAGNLPPRRADEPAEPEGVSLHARRLSAVHAR